MLTRADISTFLEVINSDNCKDFFGTLSEELGIKSTKLHKALKTVIKNYKEQSHVEDQSDDQSEDSKIDLEEHRGKPCTVSGCKVQRINKPNLYDGQLVCATHFKLLTLKHERETRVFCEHVNQTGAKYGEKCTSKAVENGYCKRHLKSTSRTLKVVKEDVEIPQDPVDQQDHSYWNQTKELNIKYIIYNIHKPTNLVIERYTVEDDQKIKVIGGMKLINNLPVFHKIETLDENIIEWCKNCNVVDIEIKKKRSRSKSKSSSKKNDAHASL